MTEAETAVRARRKLTNRLIAEHQAARLRPFFSAEATVTVGGGGLLVGANAITAAFASQFREPGFVNYERTTDAVEISATGEAAAESGRWVGRWMGRPELGGRYLAGWRKAEGQWLIEQELYVTLVAG